MKLAIRRCRSRSLLPLFVATTLSTVATSSPASADDLLFASDVHYQLSNLRNALAWDNYRASVVGLVGDYSSGTGSTTQSTFDSTFSTVWDYSVATPILSEGNHDYNSSTGAHYRTDGPGMLSDVYGDNYNLYVIGATDFATEADWLWDFFDNYQDHKVIIIMSHYPLHLIRSSDGLAESDATDIFNVLQWYGQKYDIIYLWGHNHSSSSYDTGVNYVALPNQTIGGTNSSIITSVSTAPLNFAYVNAGYINPISGTAVSYTAINITSSTITIDRQGNPNDTYYDTNYPRKTCGNAVCDSGETACTCYEDCGYAAGSCDWQCGGQGSGECFCDDACASYGDCCEDKHMMCAC